jgi:protein-S-isoprenylcysteine O-methyltransferase Ste14
MVVYGILFLGTVLALLPWVFYQIDVFMPAVHMEIGSLFRVLGGVLFAAALTMYLLSSYVLTRQGKGAFVEFDPPTELVVTGPFRYTRNPVAAFLLASMLGLSIALSSTGVLLMFLVFTVLANIQVRRIEEPLLRERYGQAYEQYCAHVPRWFPRAHPWDPPGEKPAPLN